MMTPLRPRGCPMLFCALLIAPATALAQNPDGLTANQRATSDGVLTLCRDQLAGNQSLTDPAALRLRDRCTEIVLREDVIGDVANALQSVQAEEIEILGSQSTEAAGNHLQNIGKRLQAIRAGVTGMSVAGVNSGSGAIPTGGMASTDGFSRLGVFLIADYASGDRDESDNVDGYDFDNTGLSLGADYRFTDSLVAGMAYHYLDVEADIDRNFGDLETEAHSLTLYATHFSDNYYLEATLGFGNHEFDSTRNVDYHVDSTFHEVLTASPDGDQLTWSLGAGYLAQAGALNQSYYVHLNAIDLDIDGYTERTNNPENGAMAMIVSDQEVESLKSELGAQFSYALSRDFGVVLPYLDVAWIHEFEDGDSALTTRYANADLPADQNVSNVDFRVLTDDYDANYFRVSLGVSCVLAGGMQMFVNYDSLLGLDDISYNGVSVGIRKEL